jgi:cytochrome c-type biogenesis protein CcmE
VAYLYTPHEVLDGSAGANVRNGQARFRLGGMVAAGSFKRAPGSMEAHFEVDDGDARIPVVYTGILPDLFREKQSVIATGRMRGDVFVAEQVLAKHDETYMPKEVADKMAAAHRKHQVQHTPAAEGAR